MLNASILERALVRNLSVTSLGWRTAKLVTDIVQNVVHLHKVSGLLSIEVAGLCCFRKGQGFESGHRRGVGCQMDVVTVTVVLVIVASYLVGALTSSVETERELPHRFQ